MSAAGAKGETRIEEPTAAERAIARRAAEARATVPDLELRADLDMEHVLELSKSQRLLDTRDAHASLRGCAQSRAARQRRLPRRAL